MKTRPSLALLPIAAATLLFGGCGKQEATKTPSSATAPAATSATPEVNATKATVDKTLEQTKPAAEPLTAEMTKQAQRVIDKAVLLMGDKKYQEAINLLQQLATSKISPEQRKIIDELLVQARGEIRR